MSSSCTKVLRWDWQARNSLRSNFVCSQNYSKIKYIFTFRENIFQNEQHESYRQKTLDSSFKGVVFDYLTQTLYSNQQNYKNFTYKICKESFLPSFIVFYMRQNFYLVEEIDLFLGKMKSSGIINHYVSRHIGTASDFKQKLQFGPSQMTMNNFKGIFEICFCCLLISLFVFLVEIIVDFVGKRRKFRNMKFKINC